MSSSQRSVVVLGAGLAGFHAASELVHRGFSGSVTLIGDEAWPPYDRPPLSKQFLLDGDETAILLTPALPAAVRHVRHCMAVAIDTRQKMLHTEVGSLPWDSLVIATGARARRLPHLESSRRVRTLRTLEDARAIRAALPSCGSVLVVGGGPIGLEIAATASRMGVPATVVEGAKRLMSRSLPASMAELLLEHHRRHGITVHLERTVISVDDSAGEAVMDNELRVPAGLIVVGVGVQANDGLAAEAGIACDDGILVDQWCRTTAPDVYAVGDVTRQRNPVTGRFERIETWSNAQGQGKAVAAVLCDQAGAAPFNAVPWFWSDQGDARIQVAGTTAGDVQAARSAVRGGHVLLQWTRSCVSGVAAFNAPREFVQLKRLIMARPTVTPEQFAEALDIGALVHQGLHTPSEYNGMP